MRLWCCCCPELQTWPEKAKALTVAIILFTLITAVQFVAALVSNSDALLVDCASMFVDAMTYVFNLVAECKGKDKTQSAKDVARRALISSGFSIIVLYGITAWGLSDAIGTIVSPTVDDLEPSIVLLFGGLGVVFDGATLMAFRLWGFNPDDADPSFGLPSLEDDDDDQMTCGLSKSESSLVNMCSALTHVLADSIRSLTSIFLGLIVMLDHTVNGSVADGYATLVVASTIIIGNVPLVRAWIKAARLYFTGHSSSSRHRRPLGAPEKVVDLVPLSLNGLVKVPVSISSPRHVQEERKDASSPTGSSASSSSSGCAPTQALV